jgi:hypothetical protein
MVSSRETLQIFVIGTRVSDRVGSNSHDCCQPNITTSSAATSIKPRPKTARRLSFASIQPPMPR